MASKIQSHNFYVAITPYKVEDSSGEEFNELSVRAAYDDRRKYFYVSLHAGWKSSYGGHGCILMGADDPLTGPKYVKVKDAPKNSQKTINEIGANLEQAKDAIVWLFDHREWTKLYLAVGNIARNGYPEEYRKQMEDLINNNSNQNKEDENMRLNINNQNETKNVQTAQVNNTVEDVNVGEVTVDSIMPVMQPVEGSEYTVESDGKTATFESVAPNIGSEEKPAVTVPLGDHGTLVVGGVPKRDKVTLKRKTAQPKADVLPAVRLVTYKTKKGADAPMIVGFGGDDDPRWKNLFDAKPKWVSAGYRRDTDGNQVHHLMFGTKYMAVAKALCDAYNTDDRKAWEAAEKACADNYSGIVAGYQAEKAARKAEKAAKKPSAKAEKPAAPAASPAMSADDAAMFELFKKFMAGDKEAMAKVGAVLNKAA